MFKATNWEKHYSVSMKKEIKYRNIEDTNINVKVMFDPEVDSPIYDVQCDDGHGRRVLFQNGIESLDEAMKVADRFLEKAYTTYGFLDVGKKKFIKGAGKYSDNVVFSEPRDGSLSASIVMDRQEYFIYPKILKQELSKNCNVDDSRYILETELGTNVTIEVHENGKTSTVSLSCSTELDNESNVEKVAFSVLESIYLAMDYLSSIAKRL